MPNLVVTTKDASAVLNTMVANYIGEEQIAEDLSNIADFGKVLSTLEQADVIDNMNAFVRGIAGTYFDNRSIKKRTLGLRRTKEQFAGIIQRVKMDLMQAESTDIYALQKGKKYDRGLLWKGNNFDVRVFVKNVSYRVVHQYSFKDFISSMNTATGVMSFVAMIEATAQRTLDVEEYNLELAMVKAMIAQSPNKIHLITEYKNRVDASYDKDGDEALDDADFMRWAGEMISELYGYATTPNKTYNDGTITTYCPEEDLKSIFLNKFIKKYAFNLESDTFNMGKVSFKVDEIVNAWQGTDGKVYPSLAEVGHIDVILDGDDEETTVEACVGCIFDSDGCVFCDIDRYLSNDVNGDGAFNTVYDSHLGERIIDPRNTAIVLCLD